MARRARSLDTLLSEVNRRFPNRSKASDGWLGDPAHASRPSDHNPNSAGVVCAVDITEDDAPGVSEIADFIVRTIVARKDHRVSYLIHEGRIWRSYDKPGLPAWTPDAYTGPNAHTKHVHVSVKQDAALYDSAARWGIYPPPSGVPSWYTRPLRLLDPQQNGPDVAAAQRRLTAKGFPTKGDRPGYFGRFTAEAVRDFQGAAGRRRTGIIGSPEAKLLSR